MIVNVRILIEHMVIIDMYIHISKSADQNRI
jgi:hypothetical protein